MQKTKPLSASQTTDLGVVELISFVIEMRVLILKHKNYVEKFFAEQFRSIYFPKLELLHNELQKATLNPEVKQIIDMIYVDLKEVSVETQYRVLY